MSRLSSALVVSSQRLNRSRSRLFCWEPATSMSSSNTSRGTIPFLFQKSNLSQVSYTRFCWEEAFHKSNPSRQRPSPEADPPSHRHAFLRRETDNIATCQ